MKGLTLLENAHWRNPATGRGKAMKEPKPEQPSVPGTSLPGHKADRSSRKDLKMQTDMPGTQGRLTRDVQRRLGDKLKTMFDEIVNEGVPDRFAKLLEQLDSRPAANGPSKSEDPVRAPKAADRTNTDPETSDRGSR